MLYVFFVCILILCALIGIAVALGIGQSGPSDAWLNENGDHEYYERAIIKKKKFINENPNVSPKDIRTFKNIFYFFNRKS